MSGGEKRLVNPRLGQGFHDRGEGKELFYKKRSEKIGISGAGRTESRGGLGSWETPKC